jgi:hypothetical protein|nr:MAG TPA_asm: hypothetical protein [Caudoviricetes sp.]
MKIYNVGEIVFNEVVNGFRTGVGFTEYSNETGEKIREGRENVKVGSVNVYQLKANRGKTYKNGKRIYESVCFVYTNTTPHYLKNILNENECFWKIKKGGII